MTRYRLTYRNEPRGPWRDTRKEAWQDAVDAGLGAWDEHDTGQVYLEPFVEIEREDER